MTSLFEQACRHYSKRY